MKSRYILLLCILAGSAFSSPVIQVFVSFSMPEQLLTQTLTESAKLHIPAMLNGLYHNSMPETANKVLALTKQLPDLNLQIDPTAFERYGIKQVPAMVVSDTHGFDVIYGNLALKDELYRIADGGNESGLRRADVRRILGE